MSIILLLIPLALFPSNSPDFTAYAIGAGGAEIGAQVADLFIPDDMPYAGRETLKVFAGLFTSAACQLALRHHFATNSEEAWCGVGRGHWVIARVSFDTIRHFVKRKKPVATMERYDR